MALFSLVDEELEHGLHLGQLLSRFRELGLQLLRPVVHDGRDGVDGVIQTVRVVVGLSGRSAERGREARLDRRASAGTASAGATRSAPSP